MTTTAEHKEMAAKLRTLAGDPALLSTLASVTKSDPVVLQAWLRRMAAAHIQEALAVINTKRAEDSSWPPVGGCGDCHRFSVRDQELLDEWGIDGWAP